MNLSSEIVDTVAVVISVGYGVDYSFNPSKYKFDVRFYIPICIFSAIHFSSNIALRHIHPEQRIQRFVDFFIDPILLGAAIGVAVAALVTGGWNHKLVKAPPSKSP